MTAIAEGPWRFFAFTEYNRNVTAGTKTPYTLRIYNRPFVAFDGEYRWTVTFEGQTVDSGSKPVKVGLADLTEVPFEVVAPKTSAIRPFTVAFELVEKGQIVQKDAFAFCAVPALKPSAIAVPKGIAAVLYDADSPLKSVMFPAGTYTSAAAAIAAQPKAIVIHGHLSSSEGSILDRWAKEGGRVLQLEPKKDDWSVAALPQDDWGRVCTYAFRRDDARMTDLPEAAMGVWAGDGIVARLAIEKPAEDASVLWDSAHDNGVRWADVLWIWRNGGGWLVSTLEATARFGREPIAPHVIRSLLGELVNPASNPPRRETVLVGDGKGAVAELLGSYGTAFETGAPAAALKDFEKKLVVFDAANGALSAEAKAAVKALADKKGARVLILNMGKDEDAAWLAFLGIAWEKPLPVVMAPVHWNPKTITEVDQSRHFFVRTDNANVMAGISNEDLFWWDKTKIWSYYPYLFTGSYPSYTMLKTAGEPVSAYFESADKSTYVRTSPGAIGVRAGKGLVAFASFRLDPDSYAAKNRQKAFYVVKTLMNNMGGATTKLVNPADFTCLDLAPVANSSSLLKPTDGAPALPGSADYRYFPVNRCGWSLAAHNYCPVENIPTSPIAYDGIPFLFVDPAKNRGCDILFSRDGNKKNITYTVKLPKPMKVGKAHFIGWGMWKSTPALVRFGAAGQSVEMKPGVHFDKYGSGALNQKRTTEGKIIFEQMCEFPLSERGEKYEPQATRAFLWTIENPDPTQEISELVLEECNSLGCHAITVEAP